MNAEKVLSDTPEGAVQDVIDIAQKLADLMDSEANNLAMNDPVAFVNVQNEKEVFTAKYQQASQEFMDRKEEFRNVNPVLMQSFKDIQDQLKVKAESNAKILKKVQLRQAEAIKKVTKVMGEND